MTREEEKKLIIAHKEGDKTATQKLIDAQMRLIRSIAREYKNYNLDYEDLLQEGVIGLLIALARFDPEVGTRLSTYAINYIRNEVGRAAKDSSLIRQPYSRHADRLKLLKAEEAGIAPEETGLSATRIKNATLIEISSIDIPVSDDTTIADLIAAPEPDPDYKSAVDVALDMLPDDDKELLARIYGIGRNAEPIKDIADSESVTITTIANWRDEALRKLRSPGNLKKIRKELR